MIIQEDEIIEDKGSFPDRKMNTMHDQQLLPLSFAQERLWFLNKIDNMMNMVDTLYSGAYAIKPHPKLNKLYGKMSDCKDVIPPFIPLEFVLKHPWKMIIGIESTSIIFAAKQTGASVISLIDAFEFNDKKQQKMFREWMKTESKNTILFPKNLDAFQKLLKEEKVAKR